MGSGASSCLVAVGSYAAIVSLAFVVVSILYSLDSSDCTLWMTHRALKSCYIKTFSPMIIATMVGRLLRRLIRTKMPIQLSVTVA